MVRVTVNVISAPFIEVMVGTESTRQIIIIDFIICCFIRIFLAVIDVLLSGNLFGDVWLSVL